MNTLAIQIAILALLAMVTIASAGLGDDIVDGVKKGAETIAEELAKVWEMVLNFVKSQVNRKDWTAKTIVYEDQVDSIL